MKCGRLEEILYDARMAEGSEPKGLHSSDAAQGLEGTTRDFEAMVTETEERVHDFDMHMAGKPYERVEARGEKLAGELQGIFEKLEAAKEYFNERAPEQIDELAVTRWESVGKRVAEAYERLRALQAEVQEEREVAGELADTDRRLAMLNRMAEELASGTHEVDDDI